MHCCWWGWGIACFVLFRLKLMIHDLGGYHIIEKVELVSNFGIIRKGNCYVLYEIIDPMGWSGLDLGLEGWLGADSYR